jgi:hypothetical protein
VRALGWHWLEADPFVAGDVAIVGSVGWYDYSFAPQSLGVPRRFYEAKVSPGAADRLSAYSHLLGDDVPLPAMDIYARWNDGKFVRLGQSDEAFLQSRIEQLRQSLVACGEAKRIVAAVHHVPFADLLPPRHSPAWDFARAYLGSDRIGQTLLEDARISHVYCGHSHFAAERQIERIHAINIGSGYRQKHVLTLDL